MRIKDAYDLFAEFEYPIDCQELIDEIGDRTLEAPGGSSERVGEVLERGNQTTVRSVDGAYALLVGNVSEAYVGRKFYDDRSSNPHRFEHVSF